MECPFECPGFSEADTPFIMISYLISTRGSIA